MKWKWDNLGSKKTNVGNTMQQQLNTGLFDILPVSNFVSIVVRNVFLNLLAIYGYLWLPFLSKFLVICCELAIFCNHWLPLRNYKYSTSWPVQQPWVALLLLPLSQLLHCLTLTCNTEGRMHARFSLLKFPLEKDGLAFEDWFPFSTKDLLVH